ncbi:MAG TPA: B12-binding domain-containing radical SAM protein [Candidatus Latescibacteria bacterium]|nr:B12-binding domain-containing radical SAM protein [Candidatus Latescibacterota bacterium]
MRVLLAAMPNVIEEIDRGGKFPSLGLVSLAGNVDGAEVKVADLVLVRGDLRRYWLKLLREYEPGLIGLSCMTFQYDTALALARLAKEWNHKVKVALGGYHPTLMYEEIGESPEAELVDFVVRGEGEATFRELVGALKARDGDLDGIPGLSYRDGKNFRHNPSRPLLDLSEVRSPDRYARILRDFRAMGFRSDAVETSRGCTFSCSFCCIRAMYGRSFRAYPLSRVTEDIKDARAHGAEVVFFVDDNITLDPERFEELCDRIVAEGLDDLRYFVQAGVGGIAARRKLVPKMAKAGFRMVFLGIENISWKNLDFLSKVKEAAERAEEAISRLKGHGIFVMGGFVLGNPDDTEEDFWENFEFAQRLRLDGPLFFIATPYPKTPLRETLMEEGLITNPDDFSMYTTYRANVRTRHLSSEDIERIEVRMYIRFMSPEYLKYTNFWRASTAPFFLKRLFRDGARVLWRRALFALGGDRAVLRAVLRQERRQRRRWLLED